MIDVLNQKVKASDSAPSTGERKPFEPLPEAEYVVEVTEIKPWKASTKDVWVSQRDGNGRLIKDSAGKIVKELHKNLTFYNCNVTLTIAEGEFKGRKMWTNLTTHPNATFITENFLYAVEEDEITYGQIPTICINKKLVVGTENKEYTVTATNADTGLEEEIKKVKTEVKTFQRLPILEKDQELEV